jgi:hypothetical protein
MHLKGSNANLRKNRKASYENGTTTFGNSQPKTHRAIPRTITEKFTLADMSLGFT